MSSGRGKMKTIDELKSLGDSGHFGRGNSGHNSGRKKKGKVGRPKGAFSDKVFIDREGITLQEIADYTGTTVGAVSHLFKRGIHYPKKIQQIKMAIMELKET